MAGKKEVRKSKYPNLEDYSSLRISNPISNFEVDAEILVGFFNEEYLDFDEIYDRISECHSDLEQIESGLSELMERVSMGKSAKKSKHADINKRLAKLGGFTKEDEETEDDDDVEVEVEDDGDVEIEIDEDEIPDFDEDTEKGCRTCGKASKSMMTNKKRMKMRKAEDMPEDADDQQDQNEKGSGSAGSELPEDADDFKDENEKGSGNAGKELPEDADDQQDIKESAHKSKISRSRNKSVGKNVRKYSVTNGGSPDQTSYNGRYQQSPMVRDAIDKPNKATKSFDEVAMLQERIDALSKSKRNLTNDNGVPKHIRKEAQGDKCVNYLDLPVCPNCGSPNLHEIEHVDGITNCRCDRCNAKCWFDESFDTSYGADHLRYR